MLEVRDSRAGAGWAPRWGCAGLLGAFRVDQATSIDAFLACHKTEAVSVRLRMDLCSKK